MIVLDRLVTVVVSTSKAPRAPIQLFGDISSTQDQAKSCPHATRSVLLISERNARHIVGVLRYLGRTNAVLPPELLTFAQGLHVAREDLKTNRPLCSYLKSFGVCRSAL